MSQELVDLARRGYEIHGLTHRAPAGRIADVEKLHVADLTDEEALRAVIEAVQTGIWQSGVHDLLGYATDYAFGDKRGLQTLVLKSKHRSAYVRLQWETIMGNTVADRQQMENAIKNAIRVAGEFAASGVNERIEKGLAAIHPAAATVGN